MVVALFVLNVHYPSLLALAELKAFDLRMYARGTLKPQGDGGNCRDRRQEHQRTWADGLGRGRYWRKLADALKKLQSRL